MEPTLADKRLRLAKLLMEKGTPVFGGISRRPPAASAPLSFAQQRLWFLDRLVPGSTFYNTPAAVRIHTPLDPALVRRALDEIVRRHEVLRTSIVSDGSEARQVIVPPCSVPFELFDLRHLDEAAREREAIRLTTDDALRPFDLSRAPLVRAAVIVLGQSEHLFLLNMHHIVSDGWSMGVLIEEFRQLYAVFGEGRPSPLAELPIQYADFAVWQRERLAAGALDEQLRYWTHTLANAPELALPTDFPHTDALDFRGETLYLPLPKALSERVHAFSREHAQTSFVTLLAAFNALLHRYTGQDDIVVGEPVANRTRVELEGLIGLFTNLLVLRTDLSGDPTFRELLHRTRNVVLEADANQEVPFELLVERLNPERSMGRNPLFQVSFQYFTGAGPGSGSMVSSEAVVIEKGTANLDLSVDLMESEDGLLARVEFSTQLFRRDTVQRLIAHYGNLLADFVANPDRRVSEAAMLSESETQHLLSLNAAAPVAPYVAVTALVEAQVRGTPERVALDDGERRLTYAELDRAANRLARRLRAAGAGPETLVAVHLERSIDAVVAVLATWKAGAAYMPLEPSLPEERLRLLLRDAKPSLGVTRAGRFGSLEGVLTVLNIDEPSAESEEPLDVRPGQDDLAYVIYTSGSTGTPKGVLIPHGAISRHLQWMQTALPLSSEDATLFKYAFGFDVAVLEMFSPLIAGARMFVMREDGPLDLAKLARLIQDRAITTVDLVPSMLAVLLEQPLFAAGASLRRVVCGGEAMRPELLERLLAMHAVEFVNMYGPTEATISATWWRTRTPEPHVPIGKVVGTCSAVVLDSYRNLVPTGVPGELYLGGPCLARGYLNRPDLTRQSFVRNPFSRDPLARLYRTGDRCRMRGDGTIEFLGRIDEMVKIRGHRVELGEVEAVLSSSPFVKACTAAVSGENGREELAAYIVPNTGEPELWPSAGEYFVYDELLYQLMTQDHVRMRAYHSAIRRAVRDKVVVDIGTGADIALGRMCLEAGARRVYAIEMLEDAHRRAANLADELGLGDRFVLIRGDARKVQLPEKADVCVSELLGTIGSSEGVIPVLNDAQSFLRPGGEMIPYRCITRVAAVSLPAGLRARPEFGDVARSYTERIFAQSGRRFDLRICLKNLSPPAVVSDAAIFEDLTFDRVLDLEEMRELRITIARDALVDGLLLWIQLYPGREELIDVIGSETSWLPVFFPIFSPPVALKAGDVISAVASRLVEKGSLTPDYVLRGSVLRGGQPIHSFTFDAPCNDTRRGSNPFYAAMHQVLETPESSPQAGSREAMFLTDWHETYEQLYGDSADARDDELDLIGWNSKYTRTPIGEEEMLEQIEGTVSRIRALGGKSILEIGCGTGLLLLRLAGDCERYVGTDFSAAGLARVRRALERRGWNSIELWQRYADDFSGIEPGSFDVVVLNSIVQYFPGMEYLLRVLEGSARAVRDGGFVFVGDVRNLRLQRMLHAGVEVLRAQAGSTAGDVRERVERRIAEEPELLVDPAFFDALIAQAGISAAEVQVRRGRHHNELTRFRYDAILQVRATPRRLPEIVETRWSGMDELRELAHKAPAVRVRGVRSARLESERAILERLDAAHPDEPAQSLRDVPGDGGVEPETLWESAAALDRDIQVTWSRGAEPHTYDVLLLPRAGARTLWAGELAQPPKPWADYANVPLSSSPRQQIVENLQEHMRRKLPEYMLPSAYVFLDALPLAPSGKINRRALPSPAESVRPRTAYAAPRTELQQKVVDVLREVLGLAHIGVEANFFHIGGHSLIATQVVSRLSNAIGVEIPLRLVFEKPVISDFAAALSELQTGCSGTAGPPAVSVRPRDAATIDTDALSDEEVTALLNEMMTNDDARELY